MDALHEIGERIAAADPLHTVLKLVVDFASTGGEVQLLLRLRGGRKRFGAAGVEESPLGDSGPAEAASWAGNYRLGGGAQKAGGDFFGRFTGPAVSIGTGAAGGLLRGVFVGPFLCRDKLVGVINLQHREAHPYSRQEIRLISTVGFLVGHEIELVRFEAESLRFFELAEARQLVEKAGGILQRNMRIGAEEASSLMKRESRARRQSMMRIAEAILIVDEIERKAPPS